MSGFLINPYVSFPAAGGGAPPSVADFQTFSHNVTTAAPTVPLGTYSSGQLAVIVLAWQSDVGATTPSGWTADASGTRSAVYYRVLNGSEGADVTVTLSAASRVTSLTWIIDDGVEAQGAVSASDDPPSLSPSWGSTSLWLTTLRATSTSASAVQPAGYTYRGYAAHGSGSVKSDQHGADLAATSATENPGAWTTYVGTPETYTIAIRGS